MEGQQPTNAEEEEYVLDEYPEDYDNTNNPIRMYSCYFCGLRSKEMKSHLILELGDTEVFVCDNFSLKCNGLKTKL